MISRRCYSVFTWLYAVLHFTSQPMCMSMNSVGDRYNGELSTILPELPQGDGVFPVGIQTPSKNSCHPFMNYDPVKKEFFSPGYPSETYPNNSDCYVILTAPVGKLITLDFRDWFDIEFSAECKNDFLEVRDGPHGFNKLIDERRFCGKEFPPMMTSTDRHLWIHFKSDENIEYKGFKAVFDFIERPPSLRVPEVIPCHKLILNEEQGLLKRSDVPATIEEFDIQHNLRIDCIWEILVKENWRVHLQFEKFVLEKPNDCDSNFIEIFSERTDMPSLQKRFCGSMADTVLSKGNIMYLRFFDEVKGNKSTFEANFTAFRDFDKASNKPGCTDDEFDCDDNTCISAELKCNKLYNCRFRWDEDDCPENTSEGMNNEHIAIIMVIFSLILSGMCLTFIFNCVKKLIRDHKTIQEYIRQSREQQLNELDKQEQLEKKSKSGSRTRSNSSPSINRFDTNNSTNTPCYVPGENLLHISGKNQQHGITSSDSVTCTQNIYTVDDENQPDMCDSACQTRESLFTGQGYSSGNSTSNCSVHTNSSPAPFSTFGYKKENKFKAEAKIEMGSQNGQYEEKGRPYSVQTTKSAPDVIVTH